MGMKAYRFVGLNADVWLPDDIQVVIDIVPSWRTNIRSNQKFTGQTYTTWHDTGNPNSNAWGERNYLHSGAEGRAVGYNFAFDARTIIQLTPLDEVTWAAGTPEGNKYSWHAEQCLNTDWNGALRVGAALHGGLCAARGWSVEKALVQHNVWYGKHCPAQIRNRGLWPTVVQMTKEAASRAQAAAKGGSAPSTSYASPKPIAELHKYKDADPNTVPAVVTLSDGTRAFYVADIVEAIRDTPRLQYAYNGAPELNVPVKKGERFRVDWVFVADDGNAYYYTPWATRIRVADTRRVSDRAAA